MKVNILLDNPEGVLNGYTNIDPFVPEKSGDSRINHNILNLDGVLEDAEGVEIRAINILTYLNANDINIAIENWVRKLRHKGQLVLADVDVNEVAKFIVAQKIDLKLANIMLHGEQQKEWQLRYTSLSLAEILPCLRNKGLKIITARILNGNFFVRAERP
jgi:GTPase SAR1 family protein